jgi:hypothetical protein
MDCMAAMPSADGRRARAFITQTEKAKKSPAIKPHPSAATSPKVKSKVSVIAKGFLRITRQPGCFRAFVSLCSKPVESFHQSLRRLHWASNPLSKQLDTSRGSPRKPVQKHYGNDFRNLKQSLVPAEQTPAMKVCALSRRPLT